MPTSIILGLFWSFRSRSYILEPNTTLDNKSENPGAQTVVHFWSAVVEFFRWQTSLRDFMLLYYCLIGMEEASCERASFISNYQAHTSDFSVIQGPAARIRPKRLPEDYFSCELLSTTSASSFSATSLKPSLFETSLADFVFRFFPQSTMRAWWRTCRYAKYSMMMMMISDLLVFMTTIRFSLCCVFIRSAFLCLFWSAGPLTSQWGRTSKKTSPKGCILLTTNASRGVTSIWSRAGRQHCESSVFFRF